jgi:hypothetical protein
MHLVAGNRIMIRRVQVCQHVFKLIISSMIRNVQVRQHVSLVFISNTVAQWDERAVAKKCAC